MSEQNDDVYITKEKNKMSMSDHEGIINHCHQSSDFCGKLFKGP